MTSKKYRQEYKNLSSTVQTQKVDVDLPGNPQTKLGVSLLKVLKQAIADTINLHNINK